MYFVRWLYETYFYVEILRNLTLMWRPLLHLKQHISIDLLATIFYYLVCTEIKRLSKKLNKTKHHLFTVFVIPATIS